MTRTRKLQGVAAALFWAALIAVRPVYADGDTEILIRHSDGLVFENENGAPRTPAGKRLDHKPTFEARGGNTVLVSIVDANPLLFKYTLKKGTATATSNSVALRTFTDSLSSFITNLPQTGAVRTHFGLAMTGMSVQAQAINAGLTSCSTRFPDLVAKLAAVGAIANAIDLAAKNREQIAIDSLDRPDDAKRAVGGWQLQLWADTLKAADKDLEGIAVLLLQPPLSPDCAGFVALARTEVSSARLLVDELEAFRKLVIAIGDHIDLDSFTVNVSENQPIEIKIETTANFPAAFKLTNKRFVGDATVTIAPFSRVALSVGAAAVYSFVRNPTFTVGTSGGQLVIQQKDNQYKKFDVAAMMEIEPRGWDLGPLSLGVQLGVSPKSDLGLFLGLSLRATGFFTLGAGLAAQQVDVLKQGLSVGQVITSSDQLKTDKTFRTGLYLHITATVPQKK
jgi:hypothetical protein